jgi:hypothetical protein
MEDMGYLGNYGDLGQTAAAIRGRLPAQLDARCDAAGLAGRHQPFDSDLPLRPRPNYAVPSGRYSLPASARRATARRGRKLSLVLAALLFAASGAAQATIINAASPSFVDVATAIAVAVDGDTVIVPAGTAAWTSTLTITKGISLIGQTTTNSVAGTAVDSTIIQDNGTRPNAALIIVTTSGSKAYRITGFTFAPLNTTGANNGMIRMGGNGTGMRLDHCHFQPNIAQSPLIAVSGTCAGVADHNVMEMGSFFGGSFVFNNGVSSTDLNGDGVWASPTNFGGANFFFCEDNYVRNTHTPINGLIGFTDGTFGCRYVWRYNHCYDIEIANHGTEGGRYRGGRALEMYNNDFHNTAAHQVGGIRSGCLLTHDNTFDGVQPPIGMPNETFRSFFSWGPFTTMSGGQFVAPSGAVPWGGASGDSPWDFNDAHGLYDSGTVTSGTSPAPGLGTTVDTLTDTTKSWATNQWVGFTARRLSDSQVGLILANTSNTLTMAVYMGDSRYAVWAANNQYQIHKALVLLDQQGRGKCDLITGTTATNTINSITGKPAWPHQALEPVYSWNDIYTPSGAHVNTLGSASPGIQANRDYYNQNTGWTPGNPLTTGVGVGTFAQRPTQCSAGTDIAGGSNPPGVGYWATDTKTFYVCTATNTWTQYYQPYTYPHPLVSGATPTPPAPSNLRVTGP